MCPQEASMSTTFRAAGADHLVLRPDRYIYGVLPRSEFFNPMSTQIAEIL